MLTSIKSFVQELNAEELQKEWFVKAEKYLKRNKPWKALMQYSFVHHLHPETEYKSKAKIKIDSLRPILHKAEKQKWIGTWELTQLKTDLFSYQKIKITDKTISFYKMKDDSIPERIENIKIADYHPHNFVSISKVQFKNNEIWEFKVEKFKREVRLFVELKTDAEGTSYMYNDHRAMIIDRKERKKAMAEEIRTYYVKQKN